MISESNSQRPPQVSARHLPGHDDSPSASTEDISVSSPPYRPVASSSEVNVDLLLPSPAYYPLEEHPKTMGDFNSYNKNTPPAISPPEPRMPSEEIETRATKPRPTVRYIDELNHSRPDHLRQDTDLSTSGAPSTITTDDENSDDYDWSGEEDLVDEEAKFEQRMGFNKPKPKGWGIRRIITSLFSTLIGSTILAGILVLPGVLVEIYWYKPNPSEHRRYVKDNLQAWLFWAASNFVISWYLAMIVDVIPVFTQFFISASWGHVSEYVKTRIEAYDSVKNTIKPFLYAASGWLSWIIIFGHVYDLYNTQNPGESRAGYTNRLQQVVEFLFFFALVICIKQMLSHVIAFFFHRTAYQDRIRSVQEALKVIEKLRQYRPKKKAPGSRTPTFSFSAPTGLMSLGSGLHSASPFNAHSKLRHAFFDGDAGADGSHEDPDSTLVVSPDQHKKRKGKEKNRLSWLGSSIGHGDAELDDFSKPEHELEVLPLTSRPGSPTRSDSAETSSPHRYPPMSPAINDESSAEVTLSHAARVLKNAVLHDARNLKGKNIGEGSMAWNVGSTQEAKRLARSIYMRFKDKGRHNLIPSDFYPAFPDEDSARTAFRVFDKDNNGNISRAEIKSLVVKVYKERRFLSRSMRDVGAALKTLDQILLLFALIVLFFVSLSVFGVQVGDSLTSVYTIGIAASFIFKNAASSAFDSIMFLFVTHPYDTGDRCFIDLENLVVKKVGLFATVFSRSDGTETYYFNSQLFTKFITNVRRSGNTFENLTMQIDWRTPLEKLDTLEKLLNEWLSTEEHRWYQVPTSIIIQSIEYQRYMSITISIGHNGNWQVRLGFYHLLWQYVDIGQDWDLRQKRKTAFHAAVQYYCRQLGISFFESRIPVVIDDSKGRYETLASSPPTVAHGATSALNISTGPDAPIMKSFLGFLPPLSTRGTNINRARRSKSRKYALRGVDAS